MNLPDFYRMLLINKTVSSVLKRTRIHYLISKQSFMGKREFAWKVVYTISNKQ